MHQAFLWNLTQSSKDRIPLTSPFPLHPPPPYVAEKILPKKCNKICKIIYQQNSIYTKHQTLQYHYRYALPDTTKESYTNEKNSPKLTHAYLKTLLLKKLICWMYTQNQVSNKIQNQLHLQKQVFSPTIPMNLLKMQPFVVPEKKTYDLTPN